MDHAQSGHYGKILAENEGVRAIQCAECGWAHLDPLPEQWKLDAYYAEEDKFWGEYAIPDWFRKEEWEHKNGYWNAQYAWESRFFDRDLRLVDVGCGAGWFLAYWKEHHGLGIGVEPSCMAVKCSPVSSLIVQRHEKALTLLGKGPVNVRLSLVLEHVRDPLEFLEPYAKLVHEGARLVVCVPNEWNPLQKGMRGKYGDWFVNPVHLNYWNGEMLDEMMGKLGLVNVYRGATFPMELWDKLGYEYVGNDLIGRLCHQRRLKLERFWGPRIFGLYGWLHRHLGWGRELLYVYKAA